MGEWALGILASLIAAGICALIAMVWHISKDVAVMKSQMENGVNRFKRIEGRVGRHSERLDSLERGGVR